MRKKNQIKREESDSLNREKHTDKCQTSSQKFIAFHTCTCTHEAEDNLYTRGRRGPDEVQVQEKEAQVKEIRTITQVRRMAGRKSTSHKR